MSTIAAAYLSYTAWSISQTSTTTVDSGTSSKGAGASSTTSSSVSISSISISAVSTSATNVSISHRAKQLYARASAERSVVDRLQAQVDALLSDRSGSRRGPRAGADAGLDFFKLLGSRGNDSIRPNAKPVARSEEHTSELQSQFHLV